MQLIKTTVHKYNRLHLNRKLQHFALTPDKTVLVIAGDNGSGKSSLCALMVPWPVDKSSLDEGGSVIREWEHNGHVYSDSLENGQHSFQVDGGDNLNAGGGLRLQETLFTEHFGVDGQLIKLLNGTVTFTSMSPKLRQYWFSRMDNFVLERLEGIVKELKDDKKEVEILLKYNQAQLSKYAVDVDVDQLSVTAKQYRDQLDELSAIRFPKYEDNLEEIIRTIKAVRRDLTALQKVYRKLPPVTNRAEVDDLRGDIAALNSLREDKVNRLMSLREVTVCIDGLPSVIECREAIKDLERKLHTVDPRYNKPEIYLRYMYASRDILDTLVDLDDLGYVSDEELANLQTAHATVQRELTKLTELVHGQIATETHLAEDLNHPINCPKCSHVFGKSGDLNDLQQLRRALEDNKQKLAALREQLSELSPKLDNASRYKSALVTLQSRLTTLSPVYCAEVIDAHPNVAVMRAVLHEIVAQLQQAYQNVDIENNIAKYREHLAVHEAFQLQQETLQLEERDILNNEITEIDQKIEVLTTRRTYLISRIKLQDDINAHNETLIKLGNQVDTAVTAKLYSGLDKAVSISILEIRSNLADIDNQLHMYNANIKHHTDIMATINSQMAEVSVVDGALQCLDGKRGFIGHMYKQRLKEHIETLNNIIAQLWNYDLVVMIPSDAMTFRFPLHVDGVERNDVSEGSKGMREIIDLAFMLLVRQYCQVNHLPLILDEFGSALDAVHLDRAFMYLDTYGMDQLVMVSHLTELMNLYDDTKANYIVLSDRHLDKAVIPNTANECISFL